MRYMDLAISAAKEVVGKQHIGAVVLDKGKLILSIGHNSYTKTHPMQGKFAKQDGNRHKIYLHAEIAALVKCRKTPYAIYVARVNKNNELRNAKPCPVCMLALKSAGVKKVFYTASDHVVGELIL